MIRWEEQHKGAQYLYVGDNVAGMVGRRSADPSRWWWTFEGGLSRRGKQGETGRQSTSMRAVERALQRWLDDAQLISRPSQPASA